MGLPCLRLGPLGLRHWYWGERKQAKEQKALETTEEKSGRPRGGERELARAT